MPFFQICYILASGLGSSLVNNSIKNCGGFNFTLFLSFFTQESNGVIDIGKNEIFTFAKYMKMLRFYYASVFLF